MTEGQQGKAACIGSMLKDEGTQIAVQEYLAGVGKGVTSQSLANAISAFWQTGHLPLDDPDVPGTTDSLPESHSTNLTASNICSTLSSRTAASWLHLMDYKFRDVRKGVYNNGHEQEDVVRYRQEVFLPALAEKEPWMVRWEFDQDNNIVIVMPEELPPGTRPAVLVAHDESTFDSNNGRARVWCQEGGAPLRKTS
jgi:hypothetical protein